MKPALLLLAALAAAAGVALGATALTRPDPFAQAVSDGCRRNNIDILQHLAPNWVYVNDKDFPASGRPPPPQWLEGVVSSSVPELGSHPAGIDNPFTHLSYDWIVNVKPDPQYGALVGGDPAARTGNFKRWEAHGRIHAERETGSLPTFAWPEQGDRVSMLGSWVWDCDHSASGEHTEFHPFRAIWVQRNPGGPSPLSPYGESEGDLFVSTDATPAGAQAECAHEAKGDKPAFKACVELLPDWLDVSGSYRFTLPAPPKPTPGAKLRYRVIDVGSVRAPRLEVRRGARSVTVSLEVRAVPGQRLVVAKRILVGWSPMPARALPAHLRLTVRSLVVEKALDPVSLRRGQNTEPPGEWIVYMNAGGVWRLWKPRVLRVRDGDEVRGPQTIHLYVARGAPWRFFVFTRECDQGALGNAAGPDGVLPPCPRTREAPGATDGQPGDDVPGILLRRFRSPGASLGKHETDARLAGSTCPRENRRGCFGMAYTVEWLADEEERASKTR